MLSDVGTTDQDRIPSRAGADDAAASGARDGSRFGDRRTDNAFDRRRSAPKGGQVLLNRVRPRREAAVRVTFDPYTTVLALTCAAVRDRMRGRRGVLTRVTDRMSPAGIAAFAPLVTPGSSLGPDCLTPADPAGDTDLATELDRLRGLTADELTDDLGQTFAGVPPRRWDRAAQHPRDWAGAVADVLERLWSDVAPAWRAEAGLRSREAERVGVAAARHALDVVLAQAHPRGHVDGGLLAFPDPEALPGEVTGDVLALAPVLSRLDVSISNLDRPGLVWLAYPVPTGGPAAADPGGLAALLSPVRADLLRRLHGEWTMSMVAAALQVVPSGATHHVDALVAAGLVARQRDGRRTVVRRTRRGDELLGLYS